MLTLNATTIIHIAARNAARCCWSDPDLRLFIIRVNSKKTISGLAIIYCIRYVVEEYVGELVTLSIMHLLKVACVFFIYFNLT